MDKNENFVTVVFSKVADCPLLDEIVNNTVTYPPLHKKEQNNGVVAYVLQGITADTVMPLFREALAAHELPDVEVVATVGNIFKL